MEIWFVDYNHSDTPFLRRAFVDKERADKYASTFNKAYPGMLFTVREIVLDETIGTN